MGCRVLVIGSGPLRERFFVTAARMGVATILVEESAYTRYDRLGIETHAWRLTDHGRPGPDLGRLETFRGRVDGVIGLTDWAVPIAADLALRWGLPGAGSAAASRGHDKLAVRRTLAGAGLDHTRHREVRTVADVEAFLAEVPAGAVVLKPKDGQASLGVRLVTSTAGAAAALPVSLLATGRDSALAEEYVPGVEYSLEALVRSGALAALVVTEKAISGPPHFVELGHVVAGDQAGTERHRSAVEFLGRIVEALAISDATLHVEAKHAEATGDGGWRLIELGLRPAGDLIVELVRDAAGIDLYEEQLRLALGLRALTPVPANGTVHAGVRFVAGRGTVADFPSMAPVRDGLPDIRYAERLLPPGSRIAEVDASWWRAGYVYGVSADREHLDRQLATAADRLLQLLGLDLPADLVMPVPAPAPPA